MDETRVPHAVHWAFFGAKGASGRLVLAWTLAGGILAGGILIGTLALFDRGSPGLHLLVAPALFVVGSVLGLLQSLVLAVVGRPPGTSRSAALRRGLFALLVALPLVGASWLVSAAIALGTALRMEFRWSWLVVSASGWFIGVALCCWAASEGACTLRHVRERWLRRR